MRKMEFTELSLTQGGGFWTGLACGIGISLTAGVIIGTGGTGAIIAAAAFGGFANGACGFGLAVKHFEGYDF